MRNGEHWTPSKYVWSGRQWIASRDANEVGVGSRLLGDLVVARYAENIPHFVTGRLLDLGCGKAPFYALYQPYATEAVCADWPNTKHGYSFVDVQCNLNEGVPFKDEEFDTMILSDVLEHLPEPLELWHEMARVLKPGAALLMNTPFFYWLHETPFDYYRYTEFALRYFAQHAGFEIEVLCAVGGSPAVLTDMLAKHAQFVPFVGAALADGIQRTTYHLLSMPPVRRFSSKSEQAFPFGYFLVARKALSGRPSIGTVGL